jgi:tape measure domain-containing protein
LSQYGSLGRGTAASALGQTLKGRASGAVGSALIGGAFPLLFGQGAGAATGGAIGGLVGGAFGGVGGFAGSLVGTLLGDIASRGQAVKQLAEDIGFSAQQTKQLSDAFKVANTDVEKFTAVIQNIRGVGLEIEDQAKAIQLVTRLTELYGGSFEKTGNAITSALESGKVSQATLNQLTSQGINVQQALADKYKVSRSTILEMAKDGDISVQTLIDTLVELGNNSEKVATQQQNVFQKAYDQIAQAAAQAAQTASGSFTSTGTELQEIAARIQAAFTSMFNELIRGTSEFILGLGEIARIAGTALDGVAAKFLEIQYGIIGAAQSLPKLDSGIIEFAKNALAVLNPVGFLIDKIRGAGRNRPEQFGPPVPERLKRAPLAGFNVPSQLAGGGAAKAKGPKPPEDRTAFLKEDLEAMKLMSTTQDGIRDALFEGNKELAIRLEYDQKVADINRDTAKALLNANYETEKAVIRAQEIVRLKDAELERLDKLRELERDITKEYYTRAGLSTKNLIQQAGAGAFDLMLNLNPNDRVTQQYDEVKKQLTELQDPINMAMRGAESIGIAFSESFKGVASGAITAQQALASFFQSVADHFLDMATQIIAKWIQLTILNSILKLFPSGPATGVAASGGYSLPGGAGFTEGFSLPSLLPARANGGSVSGGMPYMVGEKGPELFVPGKSGTIVPNNKLGSSGSTNVVVNVDASGSNVQGNDGQASQLGSVLAAAVQAEIIKQKKPGGLLY